MAISATERPRKTNRILFCRFASYASIRCRFEVCEMSSACVLRLPSPLSNTQPKTITAHSRLSAAAALLPLLTSASCSRVSKSGTYSPPTHVSLLPPPLSPCPVTLFQPSTFEHTDLPVVLYSSPMFKHKRLPHVHMQRQQQADSCSSKLSHSCLPLSVQEPTDI